MDLEQEIVMCEIEREIAEDEFLRTSSPGAFVGACDWKVELEIVRKERELTRHGNG